MSRDALGDILVCLVGCVALTAAAPVSSPTGAGRSQRFDYHGDTRVFLQSLPSSLGKKEKLIPIVSALAAGYPKEFQGLEVGPGERVMVCAAGQKFVYDDGATKTFEERLDHPDIEDMFCQTYPLTNPTDRLPPNFDPGRYRTEGFFLALYGASESAVARNCVPVAFCGRTVKFNGRCGAAEALRAVSADLAKVFAQKPELRVYVQKLAGTFNWRKIAGTERLSNHSFGTAIDLNLDKAAYWRWQTPAQLATFSRQDWPNEIVETFERHGFIWGGKWWHFDTMHFEYRPEIVAYARANPAPIPKANFTVRQVAFRTIASARVSCSEIRLLPPPRPRSRCYKRATTRRERPWFQRLNISNRRDLA